MDFGTWLLMVSVAYGLGLFWYDLLPASLPDRPWRAAAYPFVLMFFGEAFVPVGPEFAGLHPLTALVASLIGVGVDWIITKARHPETVVSPERRAAAHA